MEISKKHKELYELKKLEYLIGKHGILLKVKSAAKKEFEDAITAKKNEVKARVDKDK